MRNQDADLKYNTIPEVLNGKRVVVVDDSIVRGTTQERLTASLRKAGASEVHIRIGSPPDRYPNFYGIDTPRQKELIASRLSVDEIRQFVGADTLRFLSYKSLISATEIPEENFDTSCFTGVYPIDIKERASEIKLLLPV